MTLPPNHTPHMAVPHRLSVALIVVTGIVVIILAVAAVLSNLTNDPPSPSVMDTAQEARP